jgi:hypothetical protein
MPYGIVLAKIIIFTLNNQNIVIIFIRKIKNIKMRVHYNFVLAIINIDFLIHMLNEIICIINLNNLRINLSLFFIISIINKPKNIIFFFLQDIY